MGPRSLEARLTRRLFGLAGPVLVAVGASAVVVIDRVLDAGDTASARAEAAGGRAALERELAEGDGADEALEEVIAAAGAEGVRVVARAGGRTRTTAGGPIVPALVAGACATGRDEAGGAWRACAAGDEAASVVATISIDGHRAAVRFLTRAAAAVVLAGLVALWIAVRQALRAPLDELTAVVRWTEHILDVEAPSPPPPAQTLEVARLEAAFDVLVRRLLDTLARARATAAHIAHELRTPLTSLGAELQGWSDADGAAASATVARMRADVARLSDVIDAILVLSDPRPAAPSSGGLVNVADLARDLVPEGARIDAPDEALVDVDERLVTLALRNLIDNATKYAGGVSEVRVSRDGAAVRLAVRDEGDGLDESARHRMFDRHWRGAEDGRGRGLGLALVRAVAERYGGQAEARSGPGGRGLDVSMKLAPLVHWQDEIGPSTAPDRRR